MPNITIQEQIAIMQAFADGAAIEYKHVTSPEEHWRKAQSPSWSWGDYDYRAAFPVPEYRFALLSNKLIQAYLINLSAAEDSYVDLVEQRIRSGAAIWLTSWQPLPEELIKNYKAAVTANPSSPFSSGT